MKTINFFIATLYIFCSVFNTNAAQKEKPSAYIYATYSVCDLSQQDKADEIVSKELAPIYDKMQKDKVISSWGWMAHQTGGKWRRILYSVSPTLNGLFEAQKKINEEGIKSNIDPDDQFSQICNQHDDYVWKSEQFSGEVVAAKGKVGFSVYFVCDSANEKRADEIVDKHFKPIFDSYVGKNKLLSWGWSSHVIGGKYRRLSTMTAENIGQLLSSREAIIDELFDGKTSKAAKEFDQICHSHQDYIWNIQH